MASQKVLDQLDENKISYRIILHSDYGNVRSPFDFSELSGISINQIAKSLLLKAGEDFVVAVLPVKNKANLAKISEFLGVSEVEVASIDMLSTITGYERHGTTALGLDLRTLVDSSFLTVDKIYVATGTVGEELEIKPADLINVTKARVDKIVE